MNLVMSDMLAHVFGISSPFPPKLCLAQNLLIIIKRAGGESCTQGLLLSAPALAEERPWLRLFNCLLKSGSWNKNLL